MSTMQTSTVKRTRLGGKPVRTPLSDAVQSNLHTGVVPFFPALALSGPAPSRTRSTVNERT